MNKDNKIPVKVRVFTMSEPEATQILHSEIEIKVNHWHQAMAVFHLNERPKLLAQISREGRTISAVVFEYPPPAPPKRLQVTATIRGKAIGYVTVGYESSSWANALQDLFAQLQTDLEEHEPYEITFKFDYA